MNSGQQFNGLYYAGHDKSSIHFTVSSHGFIEFGEGRESIALSKTTLDLIGDPETTLQMRWNENTEVNYSLVCHDPELIDCLLTTNLMPDIKEQLHELRQKQQKKAKSEKYRVPFYMTCIVAFFFSTYFMYSLAVPVITEVIPYEWEKEIGSFAFENYQTGKSVIENPVVNGAMDTIVKRIDEFDGSDISYEVIIIDAEMLNAFAFPGGYVVVTSGLINSADKPEEVAAVLAHELTHVLERHGMRKLVRQAGLGIFLSIVLGDASALSQLLDLSSQLESLSFDRSQEQDADDGGIKILQAAGISPQYLATFFEKIKDIDSVTGNIPEVFRTHPLTDDRIERVADAAEPEQVFEFDIDWEKVKGSVGSSL